MGVVSVRVATTPRLLAELISASLVDPALCPWTPGDAPPQVTICDSGRGPADDGTVVIELGRRVEDPLVVTVDGVQSTLPITGPKELRDLVIVLSHVMSSGASSRPVSD